MNTTGSDTGARDAAQALLNALKPVRPITTHDTADYAELYFGESQTQAMTMHPDNWNAVEAAAIQLETALASLPAAEGEWRPIETAPKDGTRIDIWAHWPEHDRHERTADAYWNGRCWQLGQYNETQFVCRPAVTHWRPLPAPPGETPAKPEGEWVLVPRERLDQFAAAVTDLPWVYEALLGGKQFNAYDSVKNDEDDEDEDREMILGLGPISNFRFIADVTGAEKAEIVVAALKFATTAMLSAAPSSDGERGK